MIPRRSGGLVLCALVLVLGGAALMRAAPRPTAPAVSLGTLAAQHAGPAGVASASVLMREDFEGAWPGDGWQIVDHGAQGYSWLKRFCVAHAGMYGGSMVLSPYGGLPSCSTRYPNNADVEARYGPFDLRDATSASLTFYLRGITESTTDNAGRPYDYLLVGSSADGQAFAGSTYFGNLTSGPDGNGYTRHVLDLSDRLGQPQVWIAFWFKSDASVDDIGLTIDDLALEVTRSAPPTPPGLGNKAYLPSLSAPSAGMIVYTHHQTDQLYGVYVINPDGSGKRRVVGCQPEGIAGLSVQSCGPAWSPDGTRIAFHSKLAGDASMHIYLVNADGTNLMRLTADDLSNDGFPVWSARGDRIAFVRNRAGSSILSAAIYTIGVDKTGLAPVTQDGLFMPIDWSRDGEWLAYSCVIPERGNTGLCKIRPTGRDRAIVADDPNRGEVAPAWSPTGQQIAYVSAAFGAVKDTPNIRIILYRGHLHVIGAGGQADETLIENVAEARGLAWSPSGDSIAFAYRYGQEALAFERSDLYIIAAGGAHESRQLTNYDGIPLDQMQFDLDPNWR